MTFTESESIWGWIKSHMAQFMVILNGFILTMVAFFTVNIFVKEALRDEYSTYNDLIRKEIVENFLELEKLAYESEKHEIFDRVFLVDTKTSQAPEIVKGENISQQTIADVRNYLKFNSFNGLLYVEGNLSKVERPNDSQVSVRNLAFLTPVSGNPKLKGEGKYRVSFVNPDKFSQRMGFEKNSALYEISILSKRDQSPFYTMKNGAINQIKGNEITFHSQNIPITLANREVIIHLSYLKQKQLMLIEMVPWLLLAFGLTLTVIGWMYVWNNQQKAVLLSQVNQTLETRNRELSIEVAEREKLNQTLRKSERENAAIINAVSDVIFEIGLTGEILFLNEAWTRITRFPINETLGHNLFQLIHTQDQEEQKKNVSQLVKGQRQAYRTITRIRTIDGDFRSVEMAISMLRLDESRNLRIVGSFTDIDGQERAERALVEAERKYRTIWENAAGGIYQITPEGQFLSANPAMAQIFGYDLAEYLLRDVRNAHQQLFAQPHERLRLIRSLKRNDSALTLENQAYTKDNRKIWVQETIRPVFNDNDELIYFEGSLQDVSDRKETEDQLKEAKLQSDVANRAKSEFLANMSHELRTPLNSIIGFSEIIKNEVFGPVNPRPYWEYARDIHESGRHLLSIINQILDISRIDAGERELRDSLVDIKKVVGVCLEIVSPKAKNAGLHMIEIGVDKAPRLIGEEVAIKQMLINILSNAVKFTPAGGRVTITVESDNSGALRLSITDTGVGLDDEEIARAMSPFGVLDGRRDKTTSGIGLGLSLVQALMRLHGGRLEIFSQKGIGTTVSLVFPRERVQVVS